MSTKPCNDCIHCDALSRADACAVPVGYWLRDDLTGRCLGYVHGAPVNLSTDRRWRPLYDRQAAKLDAAS